MLIPKFIPLYPSLLQHYWIVEASILGYLDFFQCNNKDFNCTNEDLSEILNVSERTIATAIKNLNENWEIVVSKKMREWGWLLRKISIAENCILQSAEFALSKVQNLHLHNINQEEEKKEIKESEKIPTPSELVEAYKNNPQLVAKVKDESVIWLWAKYKQKRKSKAYKTIDWFIQQLIEDITTVSFWEIRYDVWDRLRYAYNKAINWDNMGIWRDDKMERWLNNQKRLNSLTPKQNE